MARACQPCPWTSATGKEDHHMPHPGTHCLSSEGHFLFLFLLLVFQGDIICPMPYVLTVPSSQEALGVFILNILLLVKPTSV